MKNLLLSLTISLGSIASVVAQSCTPGANFADSTFGAWPDTTENFPPAYVGVAYTTDLNFKVPTNASDIDPSYPGFTIQSFVVDAVSGLPSGMTYSCNISNCTYSGGANGCAQITGTESVAGVYDVTIDITATLDFMGSPIDVPYQFTGYKINVGNLGLIESVVNPISVSPNPAKDVITLKGLNPQMKISSVMITNMEGKIVKEINLTSTELEVNIADLDNGVYFVAVEHAAGKETLKFIKE